MYQPFPVIINSDYVPMVELIGIHFQIRDDYLNLQSSQVQIKKNSRSMRASFFQGCRAMHSKV